MPQEFWFVVGWPEGRTTEYLGGPFLTTQEANEFAWRQINEGYESIVSLLKAKLHNDLAPKVA